MSINLENYKNGLIKGYELAYQDEIWYEKNKNNFCDSLKEKFPNLIPNYLYQSKYDVKNYLGFNPDDLIRFGKLELVEMKIEDKSIQFWVARIPEGMSLYHSSRALVLNHSDFPLIGYDNNSSKEENYTTSATICPESKFLGKDNCTYVSYYSTPYLTKGYLNKEGGFGSSQIKYAYGITPFSKEKDNSLYNDRLKLITNLNKKENKLTVTNETEGIASYKTTEDTYLFIFGLDDILIDRPNLGKENMNNFYSLMNYFSEKFMSSFNVDKKTYERFLNLILTVTGIGSLQDNINNIKRDYPQAKNFEKGLYDWLIRNAKYYKEKPLSTAGTIKTFSEARNFDEIPGLRFSTFEHDREVLNAISYLFRTYPVTLKLNSQNSKSNKKEIQISGFVSSSLYVYTKGKGDITSTKDYTIGDLTFYASKGYFHSELGLFFAPNNLVRNRDNKYDTEYSLNYLGIIQEYRKFKTTNVNFHQGHLLEHNNWVGLVAGNIYTKYKDFGSEEIANKDIYLLAGILHDLGKSGECVEEAVYKNLNPQEATFSKCDYVKDNNEIVGMIYHSLSNHPEKGYMFLKGYKTYKRFTLKGKENEEKYNKEAQKIYFNDWERFFSHLKINEFSKRLIRIAVGTHWDFGDFIRQISNGKNEKKCAQEYLRKIECFYNDEFLILEKEDFKKVLIFVAIISIADIYGSEYDPRRESLGLSEDERNTLLNYLPNISLSNIVYDSKNTNSQVITKIIEKSLKFENENKTRIFKNLRERSDGFLKTCLEEIENFKFSPNNNFSQLYNLQYSYPNLTDVKNSYDNYFPKVIAFDLDQTLFLTKFDGNNKVEYYIYPDTKKVIEECQKLRKKGVYIALTSRHYAPRTLREFLMKEEYNKEKNPLYYKNFDFIVSRYTGPLEKIEGELSPEFFSVNGNTEEGFMMDNTGKYFNIDNKSKFKNLWNISKDGHFNLVKKKFKIDYSDIIEFDDDDIYFKGGSGLKKNVFIAGVLTSPNPKDQGIRYSLFKDGIAHFIFNKLMYK